MKTCLEKYGWIVGVCHVHVDVHARAHTHARAHARMHAHMHTRSAHTKETCILGQTKIDC